MSSIRGSDVFTDFIDRVDGLYRYTLDKIAPDGVGTKAIIAILILGFAVNKLDGDKLYELALMAAAAFLAVNAALKTRANGGGS